jgi:hypothetical protein
VPPLPDGNDAFGPANGRKPSNALLVAQSAYSDGPSPKSSDQSARTEWPDSYCLGEPDRELRAAPNEPAVRRLVSGDPEDGPRGVFVRFGTALPLLPMRSVQAGGQRLVEGMQQFPDRGAYFGDERAGLV